MYADTIEEILHSVEEILLDGEKFPNGRIYDPEREKEIMQFAVPNIILAYRSLVKSKKNIPQLQLRIFYLARDIDHYNISNLWYMDKTLIKSLHNIAEKGRKKSLAIPKTAEERIELGRLFSDKKSILAAQLRDPKRGCSSSICSNCSEPIAFCNYICDVCNYELINAHDMPTISEWEKKSLSQRLESLKVGYEEMVEDISIRGDWRGQKSPLNRFKSARIQWENNMLTHIHYH